MNFKLYVITNQSISQGKSNLEVVKEDIAGGADIIQLREKNMSAKELVAMGIELKKITARKGIPLIVNDRVDIALAINANGVHLGQDDLPIKEARKILGRDKIIGISTHSLEQAKEAEANGADYIGVGPVFATQTKPDYTPVGLDLVKKVSNEVNIPFVAIGGIKIDNVGQVLNVGVDRVAVVSGIVAADNVKLATKGYYEKISK
ncbi:thiamine phosphate synthase [Candidatus Frackibacter sp. WG13]|uniref:thiamine phosphate synthase n=1 Tax=Candidatus Frackibacter sp. WG13 TaxID=2017978 RepID=UPI0008DF577A|nr:thiamine phosphate synthase [Candidatus Frackibacter sp. WG13]SFL77408.1 thiamine-phosphate diphosphorylase [Candidatus Frackibacter sp. WG13]